jgi:hypothetical protein
MAKPSHITLPTKPRPQDIFTTNSALDSAPTPSSAAESPSTTPFRQKFGSVGKNAQRGGISPADSRRPTFNEPIHPRFRRSSQNASHSPAGDHRAASSSRRFSRSTMTRRHGTGEGGDHDNAEEDKPAIPTLVAGIRPAYATPLPVLAMVVLSIVSMLLPSTLLSILIQRSK